AGEKAYSIQMGGSQQERPGPIRKAARGVSRPRPRLEKAPVNLGRGGFPEECAERATEDVAALMGRKKDPVERPKAKAEAVELKPRRTCHLRPLRTEGPKRTSGCCIMVRHLTLVYRFAQSF